MIGRVPSILAKQANCFGKVIDRLVIIGFVNRDGAADDRSFRSREDEAEPRVTIRQGFVKIALDAPDCRTIDIGRG